MSVVLSLCDRTATMVRPWADAGHECWVVDIQHEGDKVRDGVRYIGADIRSWLPPYGTDYAIVFAFPLCTHLAVSGARWFKGKGLGRFSEAIELVERCNAICEAVGAPYMIENPVSTLSSYWRAPDYTFDPCDYGGYLDPEGDHYTKRTCLWTGGGFRMPPPKRVYPHDGSKLHLLAPSPDRADIRSQTPAGFARAVFQANTGDET